ncbi:MAG: DUF4321 domain-containing protein [Calditrichaeota bacterium]|nr:MAG: DUF4321 domain-containing protein [Calditrichota bacterium]
MQKKRSLGYYLFIIILGGVVGSVLGDALGQLLPMGVVRKFFLNSVGFKIDPTTVHLSILSITFGIGVKINVMGVVGIFLISYFLRWMD